MNTREKEGEREGSRRVWSAQKVRKKQEGSSINLIIYKIHWMYLFRVSDHLTADMHGCCAIRSDADVSSLRMIGYH